MSAKKSRLAKIRLLPRLANAQPSGAPLAGFYFREIDYRGHSVALPNAEGQIER
jgi:hypothetical protein